MLYLAVIFFVLAILLGLYLLSFVLQGKPTPKGVAFTHGPLAATGLILIIIYAFLYEPAPIASVIVFLIAAVGGLVLITRDLLGKSVPPLLAVAHGLLALTGFGLLLYFLSMPH